MIVRRFCLPALVALSLQPPWGWGQAPPRPQQLRQEIRALTDDHRQAEARLAAAERQIARLSRHLDDLQREYRRLTQQQRQLHRELEKAQRRLRRHRQQLGAQLRAAYLYHRRPLLALLFSDRDPARIRRRLVYARYLTRAQATRLQRLQTRLKRLRTLETRHRQLLARLADLEAGRRETLAALKRQRQARRQALAALERQLDDRQARLRKLLADQQRLKHPADQGRDNARSPVPFLSRKGRLPWPVAGRLAVRFGARRGSGRWEGVVLRAPPGTPVRAVHAGEVIFAGWMPGYGNLLILRHDHDFLTLYGFNRELRKKIGDRVEAGEVIATVGNSGGQTRPGLYFAIRRGTRPVDPRRWCRHGRTG